MTVVVAMTLAAFAAGSLPLSLWLGRVALGVDVRDFGRDHNPGAGNVWRVGGWRLGVAAAILDIAKAAIPVLAARHLAGLATWGLVPVALAPIAGHDFTPFLRFRGGKGVAATFGAWLGLGGPPAMLALAVCFGVVYALQRTDAWTNIGGPALFTASLVTVGAATATAAVAVAALCLLLVTNRKELREPPRVRHLWRPSVR